MTETLIISDPVRGPEIMKDAQLTATIQSWLTSHGINPYDVPLHSTVAIRTGPDGSRRIEYEVYLRTVDGHHYVDPARPEHAASEKRSVPLLSGPPAALIRPATAATPTED